MNFQWIYLIILNIFGVTFTPKPVNSLHKKLTLMEKIKLFAYRYEYELLFIITILTIVVFVLAVFALVPPMDMWNNHFNEVI